MKKIIAIVLALVLVGGSVGGGIYWKQNKSAKPVNVYTMDNLTTTYWGDENESYGEVTTDKTQKVYLSDTQIVEDVLVTEGQTVKKGDVLMTYDTTLSQVELQKKELEIQKMQISLDKAKSDLSKVQSYRPGVRIPEKNQVDVSTGVFGMTIGGWKSLSSALLSSGLLPAGETEESPEDDTAAAEETEESTEAEETETETETPEETTPEETTPEETTPEETTPQETTEPETEAPTEPETEAPEEPIEVEIPELLAGKGTEKSPYVYNWNNIWTFDQAFLAGLSQGRKTTYAVMQVTLKEQKSTSDPSKRKIVMGGTSDAGETEESAEGAADVEETEETADAQYPQGTWWKMKIVRTRDGYSAELLAFCVEGTVIALQSTEEDPDEPDVPDEPDDPDDPYIPPYDPGVKYTAAEIAELLAQCKENVRDCDLELRTAQVEYKKMKEEVDNGSVVSQIDGVITSVRDVETANLEGSSLIDISGGGGYYIKGTVSELDLEGIQVGLPVTVMSYETYMTYEGTVSEISDYPTSNGYYDGSGNSNVSYYQYTVFVDESAELKEYEYVSLKYTESTQTGDTMYLSNYMIRSENGSSYVYVDNGGKLEKRTIRTGKGLWGSYTEILSGLTMDDLIAFPYGKEVKEGAPTVQASIDELYNY